jgi:uncharacterized protein (TIGR00255 family)
MSEPFYSMTGYGRAEGVAELDTGHRIDWRWELRSVNGRGLDIRLRLPSSYEFLDPRLRKVAQSLERGSVSATLAVETDGLRRRLSLDDEMLAAIADAVGKVRLAVECAPPTADGLLALKGVLNIDDGELENTHIAAAADELVAGFERAATALAASRAEEGRRLAEILSAQLDRISSLTDSVDRNVDEAVAKHHAQLAEQIRRLLGESDLPADRLAQEAALLAIKSDVREEIDRLRAHVSAARELVVAGGAVGRRLDFLGQEFLREANTLTTKAPTIELKQIGLELKAVADQFKEQVQNVL